MASPLDTLQGLLDHYWDLSVSAQAVVDRIVADQSARQRTGADPEDLEQAVVDRIRSKLFGDYEDPRTDPELGEPIDGTELTEHEGRGRE